MGRVDEEDVGLLMDFFLPLPLVLPLVEEGFLFCRAWGSTSTGEVRIEACELAEY